MDTIGFSVIFDEAKGAHFYEKLLDQMLAENCSAIEVHAYDLDRFEQQQGIVDIIKKFDFISVHYSGDNIVYHIDMVAKLDAHILTIHPNSINEWTEKKESIRRLLSIENMDWRKSYGTSVEDMKLAFAQIPSAVWTFDLNHIYSIDPTMELADDFHESFDNLSHYHLSGFKDDKLPHAPLCETRQDIIIQKLQKDRPIIIESFGVDNIVNFKQELGYIRERI
jgi:hypothetical protein